MTMGRGRTSSEDQLRPDPRCNSKTVSRFINCIMLDGKKSVAQRIVYDAFDEIEKRTKGSPTCLEVFERALENVRPEVEVRSKRVGGANYQVPMQVNRKRRQSLAFRWIINAIRAEKGKPMYIRLARELMDASNKEGKAMATREQTHRMADANKAFAHFAF
jgi:small subunit ribosomal protein S7